MAQKKILVVSQHYWPESFRITDVCEGLVDKGYKVDLLCGTPNYPVGGIFDGYKWRQNRKQNHNGVAILRSFEIPRGDNSRHRVFLNYLSFALSSISHVPKLLLNKYDKIFLYQTSPVTMTIAGIIIGKIKHIETTMYVLDLWPENFFSMIKTQNKLFRGLLTIISHWHYRQVDKLIVLSDEAKNKLLSVTNISQDKIIVLPQACEKVYEKKIVNKSLKDRFRKGFNVVFTGNISPAQSFETIIETAKMFKKDGATDINWIIVGDGMSKDWLYDSFKKVGLSDHLFLEGQKPIEKVPEYLNIADVLIGCLVKSDLLGATVPAKVMSYIASGKPIVLAMDGEAQKLINETIKCGFAGPAGDTKAFYKNLKRIYEMSPEDRNRFGVNARRYHFRHLERNIILNKLCDFIFSNAQKPL